MAPKGLLSSTNISLNPCSQSGKSCNRLLCTSSSPTFLHVFSIFVGLCRGSHRDSALLLPPLSAAGFSWLVTQSCDGDAEEAGLDVAEALADKPRDDKWYTV